MVRCQFRAYANKDTEGPIKDQKGAERLLRATRCQLLTSLGGTG
jgi:hypothetical protein